MDTVSTSNQGTRPDTTSVQPSRPTLPGVYVTERGDMLRIASEFMAGGWSLSHAQESLTHVTRLSADPCESVSECRRRAVLAGLRFNF